MPPLSDADDFGRFFAHFVFFVGPMLGFALYALVCCRTISRQWWRPLAIAVECAALPNLSLGFNVPLEETVRAAVGSDHTPLPNRRSSGAWNIGL